MSRPHQATGVHITRARERHSYSDRLFPRRFALLTDPAELEQEHREYDELSHELAVWLLDQSVRVQAILNPWPVRAAKVRFNRSGSFDRDDEGVRSFTFGVLDRGSIIDIAAWHPGSDQIGTHLGRGFALGQAQITAAISYAFGGLRVHRTPLGWLKAGRRGIVILQPALAYAHLGHVPCLEAEDEEHATELRRIVKAPRPTVRIVVGHGQVRL